MQQDHLHASGDEAEEADGLGAFPRRAPGSQVPGYRRRGLLAGLLRPQLRAHYVLSDSILAVHGKWKKPDEEAARQRYLERHTQHATHDVRHSSIDDFKEFGAGHTLYFQFLKSMAFIFGFLSVLPAAVQIAMNVAGGYYATAADLDLMTLGNFGLQSSNNNSANLNITLPSTNDGADAEIAILRLFLADGAKPSVKMSSTGFDKRAAIVAVTALDVVGVMLFFVFSLYLIWLTKHIAKKVDDETVTLPDYAVRVEHVPPDATKEELQEYFEKWGPVVQVDLARRVSELVHLVEDRAKIMEEHDMALAKLQLEAQKHPLVKESMEMAVLDAKYDLSLVNEAIRASQLGHKGEDVVEAYITFVDDTGRDTCLAAQPKPWFTRLLPANRTPEPPRFREKHALTITQAPEATDIIFQHLEVSRVERNGRRFGTFLVKVVLIAIAFIAVSIASAIRRSLGLNALDNQDTSACDAACKWKDANQNLLLAEPERTLYKDCYEKTLDGSASTCGAQSICYTCYCKAALGVSLFEDRGYCSHFNSIILTAIGAQALAVVAIVAVNMAVKYSIEKLTHLDQHHIRSREARSLTRALFLTQTLNAGLCLVVANAYLPTVRSNSASDSSARRLFFGGIFSDVTPNWYREVGKTIMLAHLLGVVERLAFIGIMIAWRRGKFKRRHKALTQTEMNKAFMGYEFELADRYGEHLSTIYVCWIYSAGIPLMYWSCAASFAAQFWLEKYELLKVCEYPINYSSDLMGFVAKVLPFAVMLHLMGAVWAFSVIGVPRSPLAGGGVIAVLKTVARAFGGLWRNTSDLSSEEVAARLAQDNSMHLLYTFLVVVFLLIAFHSWKSSVEAGKRFAGYTRDRLSALQGTPTTPEPPAPDGKAPRHSKRPPKLQAGFVDDIDPGDSGSDDWGQEEKEMVLGKVPPFLVAVRSKLLVGPTSYEIRDNPLYKHLFEKLENFLLEERTIARVEQKEEQERSRMAQVLAALPNVLDSDHVRRMGRRERARRMLDRHGHELAKAGEIAQQQAGGLYQARARSQVGLRLQQRLQATGQPQASSDGSGTSTPVQPFHSAEPVQHGRPRATRPQPLLELMPSPRMPHSTEEGLAWSSQRPPPNLITAVPAHRSAAVYPGRGA